MALSRQDIFNLIDISTKEVVIPSAIPAWGGKSVFIKQLTRGQQDGYLKRQYGETRMKQDTKANNQEISAVNIYGHDAWICVRGICDEAGQTIFTDADIAELNKKSGEAIGWLASQIVEFSGMGADAKIARGEITPEEVAREEVKN